jgi:fucose permease
VTDWSAVLMTGPLGADAATAAFAFAMFSLWMTGGRLVGDALVSRFGPLAVTRAGALVALCGLGGLLLAGKPIIGLVGFGVVGAGVATIVPILFRAGGRTPGIPAGTGIAAVTTLGYLGTVCGPPTIGFAAGQVGLRSALWIPVALLAVVAIFAAWARVEAPAEVVAATS